MITDFGEKKMEFITTEKGRHTIQFDNGMLIFSRITAHPEKGYKYIVYTGTNTTSVCVSSARAKRKKYTKIIENENFTVRVKDFKRDDKKGFPKNIISKISLSFLKKIIKENINGEYLPFSKISVIAKAINELEKETDKWDDDPDIDDNWDDDEDEEPKKSLKRVKNGKKRNLSIKPKVSLKKVKRPNSLKRKEN
jgi:hypothetical protein